MTRNKFIRKCLASTLGLFGLTDLGSTPSTSNKPTKVRASAIVHPVHKHFYQTIYTDGVSVIAFIIKDSFNWNEWKQMEESALKHFGVSEEEVDIGDEITPYKILKASAILDQNAGRHPKMGYHYTDA